MSDGTKFYLGNCLRGYVEGTFEDIDTAWSWLSRRFLLIFPVSEGSEGRIVQMYITKPNEYGQGNDIVQCKSGLTEINQLPREQVLERCVGSWFYR